MDVVVRFNDCINAQDVDGLALLMSEDHVFVDSAGSRTGGRQACLEAWRGFFAAFPDYRNVFTSLRSEGDLVTIEGHSVCTEPALAGPVLWTARATGNRLAEWRVHEDSPANRRRLDLPLRPA
ncbi:MULTISPECIES: nuclear transport factor 2 family protein [unclassified Streptomyces]|uniref:nuclear transport factor 2 family protein n=1 Tax=unclassified Streptomyces TaxID=2593676 RepID=UPI0034437898